MKIIENELKTLNAHLLDGFIEPFEDCELTNFVREKSKQIRATISILYLKALNIEITQDIYKILSATEIVHNASLLHDDVIDNADTRRNKPTISKIFNPKIAVLAGDYLISFAIEKLLSLNNSDIISNYKLTIQQMCKAEIKQFSLRNFVPKIEDYIEICTGKTAALFVTTLKSCFDILNLQENQGLEFVKTFGIYFQLKNDIEKISAQNDKKNKIYTAKDILGIEKTNILLDNYRRELINMIQYLQDSAYKHELVKIIREI